MVGFEITNSIVKKVYRKFQDPLVGSNAMLSDHFAQQNCFLPQQKCDADIPIYKGSISLASSEHNFHLCCHRHVPYIKYKV